MSIKPVDYQVMINQTNEISKVKHVQNDKNRTDQQQFLQQFMNRVEQNLHQTPNLQETSESKINREKKKGEQQREDKNGKKRNNRERNCAGDEEHLIDIRV